MRHALGEIDRKDLAGIGAKRETFIESRPFDAEAEPREATFSPFGNVLLKTIEALPGFALPYRNSTAEEKPVRVKGADRPKSRWNRNFVLIVGAMVVLLASLGILFAITRYRSAIAKKRAVSAALRGDSLFNRSQLAEAEIEYRNATRLDPSNAVFHLKLGDTLRLQYKFSESDSEWIEAARLARNSLQSDPAPSYYSLGKALTLQGNHSEGVKAFQEAIHADNYGGLAGNFSETERGQIDRARKRLQNPHSGSAAPLERKTDIA